MTSQDNSDEALTEVALARKLGLSVSALRNWRHKGIGPRFCRFGRAVRYMSSDVEAFVTAAAVDGTLDTASGRRTNG